MALYLPAHLPNLTTREAIADAIYRTCDAYDFNDLELLTSACTPDATFDFNGEVHHGLAALKADNFSRVGALLDTMHIVGNMRVYVASEDATTATATANSLAQHYPGGKGVSEAERRLLVGVRYFVDLVKDEEDGLWKVKKFVGKAMWREGDAGVMHP